LSNVLSRRVRSSDVRADSRRAIREVIECLNDGAARVGDDVGGAEVIGMDVARLGTACCGSIPEGLIYGREKRIAVEYVFRGRGIICAATCR
jgi:hypothetical protein